MFHMVLCASGRAHPQQVMAFAVEIGKGTGDKQAVGVFDKSPVSHAGKTEDTFDGEERVLAFGADL